MHTEVFEQLKDEGLISDEQMAWVEKKEGARDVSLFTDLHALLYSGILMLAGGIGILIYKNIDTIGHLTIVILTALASIGCLGYCWRTAPHFSRYKTEPPNQWFDYILLFGSLLMVTFFGYLQYQYHVFGYRWGLATFIPMVLLFFIAYYFDHKGILTMAITALGTWMGVAVEPVGMMQHGGLGNADYIVNGSMLGMILIIASLATDRLELKPHFAPVFRNFGMHALLLSLVAGIIVFSGGYIAWFLGLALVAGWFFYSATAARSFYYLLFSALYGYAGLSAFLLRAIFSSSGLGEGIAYLTMLYFIISAGGMIGLLRHYNKKFAEEAEEDVQ